MQVLVSKSQPRYKFEQEFFQAVKDGKKDKVKKLLEMVNVNAKDSRGYTALIEASLYDRKDIVKLLLEAGADLDKTK